MNKIFLSILALLTAISGLRAAETVTLSWNFAGVESTQSKVVLNNYPVKLADNSAGGQWVLNSSDVSYAKTSTTWVATGNAKTLQLGSSSVSAAGTSASLTAVSNPVPANARISAVELLVKSVSTEAVWSVSVNGTKAPFTLTSPSAAVLDNCNALRFENLDMQGNLISFTVESIATTGRYVFVAGVSVEYTADGNVPQEKVAAPEFDPASGTSVESGSYINISSATPEARIFYAVGADAFAETADGRVKIEGAVGSTVNLKAYASKDGMADSDIESASYKIRAAAVVPPFSESFDVPSALNAWTIADADNDGSTWKYYSAGNSVFIEHQIGNKGKDDWLITPAIYLKGSSTYTLRFKVRAGNANYPEKIGVAFGSEPQAQAMTNIIMPTSLVDYADFRNLEYNFTPAADGVFYLGFHAASDAGMFRLFVDDVRLSAGKLSASPAAVSDIVIVNNADGAPTAELTFKAPTLTVSGAQLASLTSVDVKRNGTIVKIFFNPAPGMELSFTDEVPAPGEYTYSFAASNEAGEGADTEVKAFVGINIPSGPASVSCTEPEAGTVLLTWEAPETTVYGDAINPTLVKYSVRDKNGNTLASDIEGTSWQSAVVDAGQQLLLGFRIYASTAAGINETDFAETAELPVGTPYELPYEESFTHWTASKLAEYITPEGCSGRWRIMRELVDAGVLAYDADDGLLAFMPDFIGDKAVYRTGKIHIPADASNPMLSFRLNNANGAGNKLTVTVTSADGIEESTEINTGRKGWGEELVALGNFAGKDVRVSFTAVAATTATETALDHFVIRQIESCDLAVSRFRMPLEMEFLRPHLVTAEVVNIGMESASGYDVELYCDGEKVAAKRPGAIARNESAIVEFSVTPAQGTSSDYKVKVNFAADTDLFNNESEEVTSEIIYPLYSPVENLKAADGASGVLLTWDAPSAGANTTAVTETFERYDEFLIDTAGDWTFYDVDKGETYGINNGLHSFPNMGSPMAFIIFNGSIPTLDTIGTMTFGAHSGNQYLASFSVRGGEITNNDWLVSPLLNGSAQKISFFARSMSIGTHEKFEFYYSKSGKSVENFVKAGEGEDFSGSWTPFEFEVPEGTHYFAIRCVSFDQYAFFLDDITYVPATSEIDQIAGYDIYRDGAKLNDAPVADTSFTDATAEAGEPTYQVYAVMPRGLAAPAEASVEVSGVENVSSADFGSPEVYNLQGVRVTDKFDNLPAGIYIIREGAKVSKIRR